MGLAAVPLDARRRILARIVGQGLADAISPALDLPTGEAKARAGRRVDADGQAAGESLARPLVHALTDAGAKGCVRDIARVRHAGHRLSVRPASDRIHSPAVAGPRLESQGSADGEGAGHPSHACEEAPPSAGRDIDPHDTRCRTGQRNNVCRAQMVRKPRGTRCRQPVGVPRTGRRTGLRKDHITAFSAHSATMSVL